MLLASFSNRAIERVVEGQYVSLIFTVGDEHSEFAILRFIRTPILGVGVSP